MLDVTYDEPAATQSYRGRLKDDESSAPFYQTLPYNEVRKQLMMHYRRNYITRERVLTCDFPFRKTRRIL